MALHDLRSPYVPMIETPRLLLRGHSGQDYAASCELWAHPEVVRYTLGKPQTPEEVWSRLLRYAGLWSLLGYGYWVVEERASGAYVGEVGLSNYKREIEPPLHDVPEIGWTLVPGFHGRGYATEAAQAALDWARTRPTLGDQACCIIHADNRGSFRVAEKCGFTLSHVSSYRGEPFHVLFRGIRAGATASAP